jgi:hypothetical protein
MLGDWLARAKAEGNALRFEKGRELQQMLEKIIEGENPYDIFVLRSTRGALRSWAAPSWADLMGYAPTETTLWRDGRP